MAFSEYMNFNFLDLIINPHEFVEKVLKNLSRAQSGLVASIFGLASNHL